MDKLELVQKIGNEVCEDCGFSDCGEEPAECARIVNALNLIDVYVFESEGGGLK